MRVALLVLALLPVALAAQPADLDLDAARAVVDTLAAPRYYGRGFAFDGATRAAQFLEGRFEAAGLQPLGPAWRHPFPYEADIVTDVPVLTMDRTPLVLGSDLLPYPSTAAGAGTAVGALDVGSGVVVPPAGIDAYAGRPVEGRVVVLSAAVPDSLVGDENVPQAYLSEVARYEIAFLRGASAVVHLVDAPLFGTSFYDAKLPVFHVRREAWTSPATVDFRMDAEQNRPVTGYNVLGAVPGTVRPDSVLLITAHYDGLGSFGAEVYFPGANDNASGVALLLALAKRVAQIKTGIHWAEEPLSRISHLITNIRLAEPEDSLANKSELTVKCRFFIYRNRLETETDFLVGRRHDVLRRINGALKFARRKFILEQSVLMAKNLTVFI